MFDISKRCVIYDNGGRWGVGVWCRLVEYLGLVETDCQAEELGGISKAVHHPLQICFCVGHQGAVVGEEDYLKEGL